MKRQLLFLSLMTSLTLVSCENNVTLSPRVTRFNPAKHLQKMNGNEELSKEIRVYIHKEQTSKRKIASASNLNPIFAPENNPKFPLSYFLVPAETAQFLRLETSDSRILDELTLRITGREHYKFFVHPANEAEFEFLKGSYDYIGPDRTEFLASPTSDYYTLVVWNRNNPNRQPFVTQLVSEKSDKDGKLNRQIIREIPIK